LKTRNPSKHELLRKQLVIPNDIDDNEKLRSLFFKMNNHDQVMNPVFQEFLNLVESLQNKYFVKEKMLKAFASNKN
jgi:hypothetical protein